MSEPTPKPGPVNRAQPTTPQPNQFPTLGPPTMPTIQENQACRPEWFIADADLPPPTPARISHPASHAAQPHGPGTIGEAWGRRRHRHAVPANVDRATAEFAAPCRRLRVARVSGLLAARSPWAEAAPATPPRHAPPAPRPARRRYNGGSATEQSHTNPAPPHHAVCSACGGGGGRCVSVKNGLIMPILRAVHRRQPCRHSAPQAGPNPLIACLHSAGCTPPACSGFAARQAQ